MYDLVPIYGEPTAPFSVETAILCNPHFGETYGYTNNCQRCVWVYELRRRGYAVIARPKNRRSARGDPVDELDEIRSVVASGRWIDVPKENPEAFILNQVRSVGESRWIIRVRHKDRRMSHVFVVELLPPYKIGSGAIVWLEPQQNRQVNADYLEFFSTSGIKMMRTDDKDFTYLIRWMGEKTQK